MPSTNKKAKPGFPFALLRSGQLPLRGDGFLKTIKNFMPGSTVHADTRRF